jgi:N-acetylneuraminic acid mutarotase
MKNTLRIARTALAFAVLLAGMDARSNGFDLNHYILGCGQVCATLFGPVAPGTIDPTFTGSWYDPGQNGHGVSLEVLPGNRVVAYWFTFDPDGTRQAWLVGIGTFTGNVATIDTVDMPTGGKWIPGFDPKQVVHNAWGSLTLTFTDADHGRLEFRSTIGFGTGSMNLVRLTQPTGINALGASPTGDAWRQINAMGTPRTGHSATLLADGKVLVVGGVDGYGPGEGVLATSELFDPQTGAWSRGPSLHEARTGHSVTRLANGRVLVTGGVGFEQRSYLSTSEIYDPSAGTWNLAGPLNTTPRAGHTATLLKSGKVLVVGDAISDPGHYLRGGGSTEVFDPAANAWSLVGRMQLGRMYGHSATLLVDGRILVVGGTINFDEESTNTAELYEPETGTWRTTASCPECGTGHAATLLPDGTVLVAGGLVVGTSSSNPSMTSAIFDPTTETWRDVRSMARASFGDRAAVLDDGTVLLAGPDGAQRYDPATGQWTDDGHLSYRLSPSVTIFSDGTALVAGGYEYTSTQQGTIRVYDRVDFYGPTGMSEGRYTGTWNDPMQPGHGLVLEALPGNQLLAEWFAFDPSGTQQSWFLGVGAITGNTATITAVDRPTGGRFIPNFDPTKIVHNPWGSLTFTFTDCDHGKVDFASTAGYGSGSMNLTRLTRPVGVSCP